MISPHFIDGPATGRAVAEQQDVMVELVVRLRIPVPAMDAPTPEEAAEFAADLLAAHPLELGQVPIICSLIPEFIPDP